ncbi:MAG: Gmad2 immunoglobulin-like domain-containing protein [Thermanaerothrix sp.]|nr:Gmad2 immunoglobulin-like domain-containing protein [Thermanaerothrix sp.]
MTRLSRLLFVGLIISLTGCLPQVIPPTPTLVPPTPTLTPTPTYAPLSAIDVLNAEYRLLDPSGNLRTIRLSDGTYQSGNDPTQPDFWSVRLGEVMAFGDLNGDGLGDAAATIAANYGGTGVFVNLVALLNENGLPRHAASYFIDDRPILETLTLKEGTIHLVATIHGPNDPGCCPTQPVTRDLRLVNNNLMLIRATSQTPGGQERRIDLDEPTDNATLSTKTLNLRGRVTIAPFENTLRYRLTTAQGTTLLVGPLMVEAPDLGAAGTFETTLDLQNLPSGLYYLEIADLSAADGSILALTTVRLNLP